MEIRTSKQFIRYTQLIDKRGLSICDGISEQFAPIDILYPLFILSGIMFFITLIVYWEKIRDFIRR